MSPIAIILLIVILAVIFGGLGGFYGPSWFGPGTTPSQGWHPAYGGGGLGLVLLILVVLWIAGALRF